MENDNHEFPPYHPGPSTGQEIGVMFGFLGFCLIFVAVYWVLWQVAQRRASRKEAARREELSARGINEKGIDQNGKQVHGMRDDSAYSSPALGQDGLGVGQTAFGKVSPNIPQGNGREGMWRN